MRISDWSSDVCSSDLCRAQPAASWRTTAAGTGQVGWTWGDPWPEPRSMADYTLDAAAPQMVACCGAAGVVRGAAGGCGRETTVNGVADNRPLPGIELPRSEEHTSDLQSLMRIPYAAFCLKKK